MQFRTRDTHGNIWTIDKIYDIINCAKNFLHSCFLEKNREVKL